ncbi:MAG: M24 family metallopeptidase [Victivallales bacterium]|nr:M24 family metallopeptidase [Victivallales bacterium]
MIDRQRLREDFDKVLKVLEAVPSIDKTKRIGREEFAQRHKNIYNAIHAHGVEVGLVFSDEHYCGDVPYLCGNCNISVEQVGGVVGPTGMHLVAGLEGGYAAEQLVQHNGIFVHKAELLQLADEKYPVAAERFEDILIAANNGVMPDKIALLTPRQVIPSALVEYCNHIFGEENVLDLQEEYFKVKYEKSVDEVELVRNASVVTDAVIRSMLAVLKPGMLETQVAAWGYFAAKELGAEEIGFDFMVTANEANRSIIGKALNRVIQPGDWVHVGAGTKQDGLNACVRRSVIATDGKTSVTPEQKYWFDMVEGAYDVGYREFCHVAKEGLPAYLQEKALVDYFAARSEEVSARIGRKIALENLKPYTGTHNSGYTECQEFYGAITLDTKKPLGNRIITMLDVALRGIGNNWDEVVIPGFDYLVIENTLCKDGPKVETLTKLPINVQHLVGNAD